MIHFVKYPNLPQDCSSIIICDKYCNKLISGLEALDIQVFTMPDNPILPGSVSYHTDLSVFHGGDRVLFLSVQLKHSDFTNRLKKAGAELKYFSEGETPEYPGDVRGNICCIGKRCILNPDTADPAIKRFILEKQLELIPVRQGYTRCSVCIVDENSIITADRMIARKAKEAGLEVLLIEPGSVQLEGFSYGFIGGAAFKTSHRVLCFTGVLDAFPKEDRNRILAFLDERSIEPVYLTDQPAFDIGGAVPLTER